MVRQPARSADKRQDNHQLAALGATGRARSRSLAIPRAIGWVGCCTSFCLNFRSDGVNPSGAERKRRQVGRRERGTERDPSHVEAAGLVGVGLVKRSGGHGRRDGATRGARSVARGVTLAAIRAARARNGRVVRTSVWKMRSALLPVRVAVGTRDGEEHGARQVLLVRAWRVWPRCVLRVTVQAKGTQFSILMPGPYSLAAGRRVDIQKHQDPEQYPCKGCQHPLPRLSGRKKVPVS